MTSLKRLFISVHDVFFSYYKGIRQMVPVSDQDMNTHLAEVSRVRTVHLILVYLRIEPVLN